MKKIALKVKPFQNGFQSKKIANFYSSGGISICRWLWIRYEI